MLSIRMQRTGRKGYAQFRIVVQDSRQTPSSARVVASIGTYNPHTKEVKIDSEKANFYLKNGAQPSERVAVLLKKQAVKLPSWVVLPKKEKKTTKNIDKLRKNRPVKKVDSVEEKTVELSKDEVIETTEATEETPIAEKPELETVVEVEAIPEAEVPIDEPIADKSKETLKETK